MSPRPPGSAPADVLEGGPLHPLLGKRNHDAPKRRVFAPVKPERELVPCRTCAKCLRPLNVAAIGRPTLPAHKCPHGWKCSDIAGTACPACFAVLDVKLEILTPACVWCSPLDKADGPRGTGCSRCRWRGHLPADGALLAELRATTVPLRPGDYTPGAGGGLKDDDEPECPGEFCKMCNGEACDLCGAGCWANPFTLAEPCEHSVDERHERHEQARGALAAAERRAPHVQAERATTRERLRAEVEAAKTGGEER